MKAVVLHERGHQGISLNEIDTPTVKKGYALIRIKAASLNQVDLYMRDSGLGIRHTLPQTMGVDGVGKIVEIDNDADFKVGDSVILYPYEFCGKCSYCLAGEQQSCKSAKIFGEHRDGTFAEYITVPQSSIFHLPDNCDFHQAASLGVAYLTAWRMLFSKANIEPGQTVMIMGGGEVLQQPLLI